MHVRQLVDRSSKVSSSAMVRCSRNTHRRRDGEQVVVVGRSPIGQVPAEARLDQQRAQLCDRQRQQPPRLLGRCNKQKVNRRSAGVFRGSSLFGVHRAQGGRS